MITIMSAIWLSAATPAQVRPAAPAKKDLEGRITDLEQEIQRLRLQTPDEAPEEPAPAPAQAAGSTSPNVFNPTITAVGNALFRYDDDPVLVDDTRVDRTFNLREVEVDMRAAIDPFADGVMILSVPSEVPGEFAIEVEEAFVTIKRLPLPILDDPPLGLKLKIGRFRAETGRVNRLHLHDLPQSTRPLVSDELWGEDGYIANGLSAQFFIPTPFDEDSAMELTVQALTGGGVAVADGPTHSPAFVANLRWFRTFAAAHSFDLSLIFHYGRSDAAGDLNAFTYSADLLYKWKPLRGGEFHSFVFGGQALVSDRDFAVPVDSDGDGVPDSFEQHHSSPFGYFAFAQVQLTRSTYLGARWDDTATILDDSLRRRAISAYLTWYTSEFLRFRFGYEHRISDLAAEDSRNSAFAELNFIFGAHPPEPFWVNR